jgi:hypothetical protein
MILKLERIYPYLALIVLAIFISVSSSTTAPAYKTLFEDADSSTNQSFPEADSFRIQSTPSITSVVNLPIIEQNAPPATPTPINGYPVPILVTPINTFTPTVTPIPIQTGSTNVPIVIGALAIIAVVVLAWFFVGYIPRRTKG